MLKPLDDGAIWKGYAIYPSTNQHFTRDGLEHKSNVRNSLLEMYFALSGFLNPNNEGSAHCKKDFSYN